MSVDPSVRLVHCRGVTHPPPFLHIRVRSPPLPLILKAKERTHYFPFHKIIIIILDNAHICISYAKRTGPPSHPCRIYVRGGTGHTFHRLLIIWTETDERLISHYDCIDRSIANGRGRQEPYSPAYLAKKHTGPKHV